MGTDVNKKIESAYRIMTIDLLSNVDKWEMHCRHEEKDKNVLTTHKCEIKNLILFVDQKNDVIIKTDIEDVLCKFTDYKINRCVKKFKKKYNISVREKRIKTKEDILLRYLPDNYKPKD